MISRHLIQSYLQDLRYGLRGLLHSLPFTSVALITLALGVGATTTIFTVVNTVLLKPLPYSDSARLVLLHRYYDNLPGIRTGLFPDEFNDLNRLATMQLAAYSRSTINLNSGTEPEHLRIADVSRELVALLDAHPIVGRTFDETDVRENRQDLVIIGYGLWQRRFGGDSNIVGKVILLDEKPYTVIGILPQGFHFPDQTELWRLKRRSENDRGKQRNAQILGRLKDGASLASAQAELDAKMPELRKAYPEQNEGARLKIVSLQQEVVGSTRPALLILLGAVGCVLLIACVNVSNLVLSRNLGRRREIALRVALGASRGRIMRQFLLESALLSVLAGVCGWLLALGGVRVVRAIAPANTPRIEELQLDPTVALFTLAVAALAGIVAGMAPAWQTSRTDPNSSLKDRQINPTGQRSPISLRNFLAVTQIAVALVLLTCSALMGQSLYRMLTVDTGLRTDHLLTVQLDLSKAKYATPASQTMFATELLDSVSRHPGIAGAAISDTRIMSVGPRMFLSLEQDAVHRAINNSTTRSVTPDFFSLFGIRLVAGRLFDEHDTATSTPVVVINETLARTFSDNGGALNKILDLGEGQKYQIAGVVADTRDISLREKPTGQIYFSFVQAPAPSLHLIVKTLSEPLQQAPEMRTMIQAIDKSQPITGLQSVEQIVWNSVSQPRFRTGLLSAFAAFGLVLTLIGLYGVIGYSVTQKTPEIGIRMALGAERRTVLSMVLGHAMKLVGIGAIAGLAGSFAITRLLATELYGIRPTDLMTFALTTLVMVAVAVAAALVPALRATRIDPVLALRYE